MQRVLDWMKRKGDTNVVSYSRFGLPGEEQDDRPPPSSIHVAPFQEDHRHYLVFGTHSQRAAVVSAGVGLSVTLFIFLSAFFEFDWYHHRKGTDVGALMGLFLFLGVGIVIHWHVVRGIQMNQGRFLVPFIIVYSLLITIEAMVFVLIINHWIVLSSIDAMHERKPAAFLAAMITCGMVILLQSGMLYSVVRCRNFLEAKSIHLMEMQVVEKSKQQFPGIRVVFGPSQATPPSIGIANHTVGQGENQPANGTANSQNGNAPPPYEHPQPTAPAPQRTILQAEDGLI